MEAQRTVAHPGQSVTVTDLSVPLCGAARRERTGQRQAGKLRVGPSPPTGARHDTTRTPAYGRPRLPRPPGAGRVLPLADRRRGQHDGDEPDWVVFEPEPGDASPSSRRTTTPRRPGPQVSAAAIAHRTGRRRHRRGRASSAGAGSAPARGSRRGHGRAADEGDPCRWIQWALSQSAHGSTGSKSPAPSCARRRASPPPTAHPTTLQPGRRSWSRTSSTRQALEGDGQVGPRLRTEHHGFPAEAVVHREGDRCVAIQQRQPSDLVAARSRRHSSWSSHSILVRASTVFRVGLLDVT